MSIENVKDQRFRLLVDALGSGEYDALARTFVTVGLTPRKPLVNDLFQPDSVYGSLTCCIDFHYPNSFVHEGSLPAG